MTNKAHSTLTGSDLHEPKGVAGATAGQVYISNGAGSGTWTDTGATIGTSNFTTGDLKPTWKTTADSGWIMCDDGSIGDISSGATTLASSTTAPLFTLLWTNFANSEAAVSSGRGASAAADYAAHKTIALPKMLGRVYGIAGSGAGLTSRVMGQAAGSETITQANLPNVNFTNSGITTSISNGGATSVPVKSNAPSSGPGAASAVGSNDGATNSVQNTPTFNVSITNQGSAASGGSGASYIPPTVFLKMMVKL